MIEATTPKRRRPRGEGSIYVGADGRARGAILVVDPDTGEKIRRVVSGRNRTEVRENLAKLRRDLDAGIDVKPGGAEDARRLRHGLAAALHQRVRPSTWRSHELHTSAVTSSPPSASAVGPAHAHQRRADDGRHDPTRAVAHDRPGRPHHPAVILRDAERDGLVARNVAALARPPTGRTGASSRPPAARRGVARGPRSTMSSAPCSPSPRAPGCARARSSGSDGRTSTSRVRRPSLTVRRALARTRTATTSPSRRRPAAGARSSSLRRGRRPPAPEDAPEGGPARRGRPLADARQPRLHRRGRATAPRRGTSRRRSAAALAGSDCRTSGSTTSGTAPHRSCWRGRAAEGRERDARALGDRDHRGHLRPPATRATARGRRRDRARDRGRVVSGGDAVVQEIGREPWPERRWRPRSRLGGRRS